MRLRYVPVTGILLLLSLLPLQHLCAQDMMNMSIVDSYLPSWGTVSDMAMRGNDLFVTTQDCGLYHVDLTNPTYPNGITWLSESLNATFAQIEGDYLFLYLNDYYRPHTFTVLSIVDPLNPRFVSEATFDSLKLLYIQDNYLYTCTSHHGYVFDISYPADPEIVSRLDSFDNTDCVLGLLPSQDYVLFFTHEDRQTNYYQYLYKWDNDSLVFQHYLTVPDTLAWPCYLEGFIATDSLFYIKYYYNDRLCIYENTEEDTIYTTAEIPNFDFSEFTLNGSILHCFGDYYTQIDMLDIFNPVTVCSTAYNLSKVKIVDQHILGLDVDQSVDIQLFNNNIDYPVSINRTSFAHDFIELMNINDNLYTIYNTLVGNNVNTNRAFVLASIENDFNSITPIDTVMTKYIYFIHTYLNHIITIIHTNEDYYTLYHYYIDNNHSVILDDSLTCPGDIYKIDDDDNYFIVQTRYGSNNYIYITYALNLFNLDSMQLIDDSYTIDGVFCGIENNTIFTTNNDSLYRYYLTDNTYRELDRLALSGDNINNVANKDSIFYIHKGNNFIINRLTANNELQSIDSVNVPRSSGNLSIIEDRLFLRHNYCYYFYDISIPEQPTEIGYYIKQYDPIDPIRSWIRDGSDIIAARPHDIIRLDGSQVLGTQEINTESLPVQLSMFLFPNPVNSTSEVVLELPSSAYLSIKVYNILGQETATVFDGQANAGTFSTVFQADQLASGVYFLKADTGEMSVVKKMVLLR